MERVVLVKARAKEQGGITRILVLQELPGGGRCFKMLLDSKKKAVSPEPGFIIDNNDIVRLKDATRADARQVPVVVSLVGRYRYCARCSKIISPIQKSCPKCERDVVRSVEKSSGKRWIRDYSEVSRRFNAKQAATAPLEAIEKC